MSSQVYDMYAAAALQALIAKLPMLDREGKLSIALPDSEADDVRVDICRTAHFYANVMMQTRQESINHLESASQASNDTEIELDYEIQRVKKIVRKYDNTPDVISALTMSILLAGIRSAEWAYISKNKIAMDLAVDSLKQYEF